jgi:hypothetical protein
MSYYYKDFNKIDDYWSKWTCTYKLDHCEEKIRNGGNVPPWEFTSVDEILNPILHLKQQRDWDKYGRKKDLWGTFKSLKRSMYAPPLWGGGANMPHVCDGQ